MEKRFNLTFAGILLTALLLRLWLAPMPGHVHDLEQFKLWTKTAVVGNPLAIYNDSTANYPPLGLVPLIAVGHIYRLFFSPDFDTTSSTLTILLKLPAITADLITAVVLFHYLNKHHSRRWAIIGLTAYALNPAVIYISAWWGQLESLVALPMLLSIIALAECRNRPAWFWLAIAVLVKPQAAVIGAVVLITTLFRLTSSSPNSPSQPVSRFSKSTHTRLEKLKPLLEGVGTAVLTTTIVLLPLIIVGQLPTLLAQIQASAGRQQFLTMNAHNFWYLITLGRGSFAAREASPILDTVPLFGPLTGWHLGLLLFFCWVLLTIFRFKNMIRASLFTIHQAVFWMAAAVAISFYLLPAEAHERYLFPALALMIPLLPGRRPFQILYIMFSTTLLLNLVWVDSAVSLPWFSQNLTWGIPIAAMNVVLLIYYTTAPTPLIIGSGMGQANGRNHRHHHNHHNQPTIRYIQIT